MSTPDRRTELYDPREPHQFAKQQPTPRQNSPYLRLIKYALASNPDKPSSLEDILNWIHTNDLAAYQRYGAKKLRSALQTSLNFQANKVESKRTIWKYEGDTWQLHKDVVADDEESVDTQTERHAYTPPIFVPSSTGRQTRDDTLESCESRPSSETRQTCERDYGNSQNIAPQINIHAQAERRLASIESRPSHLSPLADAQTESHNLTPDEAAPNASTAAGHSLSHDAMLTQAEPAAENIPMTPNNGLSNIAESRAPARSCEDHRQDSHDELDYGQIVRDLHRLKQERLKQEQKIQASQKGLPDVSTLTKSANEAQLAADEAQRVADEAHRAAETAKKAAEDAQVKKSQLAADKLYLEKLTQDSHVLRVQLDID